MIRSFKDSVTEDLFNGLDTKATRQKLPQQLWRVTARKLVS
jgi:proteic killer suppression protein